MFRKWMYAVVVAGLAVGLAEAQNQAVQPGTGIQADKDQPLWGRITRVEGNKIYFSQYDPATKKFGPAKEYPITDADLRVFQMKGKDRLPLTGGLKGQPFQNIGEQGLYGTLRMDKNRVAEIQLWNDENAFMEGMKNLQPGKGGTPGIGGLPDGK